MPSYVYTTDDLRQFQALPLEAKVTMSMSRIQDAYKRFKGDMFVSVSGGKDSDVLDHLVHEMYPDVPRVFVDTGVGVSRGAETCAIKTRRRSFNAGEVFQRSSFDVWLSCDFKRCCRTD